MSLDEARLIPSGASVQFAAPMGGAGVGVLRGVIAFGASGLARIETASGEILMVGVKFLTAR